MTIIIAVAALFFGMMLGSGISGMAAHPTSPSTSDVIIIGLETIGLGLTLIIGLNAILVGLIFVATGILFLLSPMYLHLKK